MLPSFTKTLPPNPVYTSAANRNVRPPTRRCSTTWRAGWPISGLQFYEVTGLNSEVIQQAQEKIRKRVLRLFVRRGLLSSEDAEQMQTWQNGGGFSLNAEVSKHQKHQDTH